MKKSFKIKRERDYKEKRTIQQYKEYEKYIYKDY